MSRSAWHQQSNLPLLPQNAYCRRSCTQICKFTLLHQAWCTSWILVHSPWWRIKPPNYLQQPLWEVPFPASSLWSGLLTRHLPEEDRPVPQRVPWMYGNCWWHHCTWLYWGGTQCPSAEPHAGSPQVWSCVQSTENAFKGSSHKFLWLPIWCPCCPPRPGEGQSCACSPSTHKCHWTPRGPWHGDIPQPLHPWPVHSDCSSARTPEKRCWLHLECQLPGCFSVSQASHHQQHHPQILQPITACDHTSQCLTGRYWCSTSTKQQTHSFCKQSTHWCRVQICKHREREMLAVVFGAERFCTYIYGWSFMIESDHKPLESISRKNLADMPTWLQCMMLHLQGYDLTICYCPGKEMVIPDMLSWFSPWPGPNLPLDIAIHHAHIMPDCKEAFQQAFVSDPEMQALADLIITGWPKDIKEVPCPLHLYWQQRDSDHWGRSSPARWSTCYSSCQKGEGPASTAHSSRVSML